MLFGLGKELVSINAREISNLTFNFRWGRVFFTETESKSIEIFQVMRL